MSVPLLLLAALAASPVVPAPDPRLCVALRIPMSAGGSAALDASARRMIDSFSRASPSQDAMARNALRDDRVRFVVLASYGAMRGFESNQRLTVARGRAIRDYLILQGIPADRIRVAELLDVSSYVERADLPPAPAEGWSWGYVIVEYPEARACAPS